MRKKLAARPKFAPKPTPAKPAPKLPLAEKPKPAPPERPKPAARRQVLLCPGPVMTSQAVKNALGGPDICHREPEFAELLQTIRAKLLHAFGLGGRYLTAIFSGSGTAALEAAVLSCVEGSQKLLVVNNGVYGSRLARLAKIHGIPLVEIRWPITERPNPDRIAGALKRDSAIGAIAMVHHETSTGMLNPVEEVGALAKKYRKRFLIDAISSLGAEKLDLPNHNITFAVGSAGKCLHGPVGLSFVLVAHEEYPRLTKTKPRSLYLDLGGTLKSQEASDPLFTPAVALVAAFNAALNELVKEGLSKRIHQYRQRASTLRSAFKKLNLEFLLEEKFLSNSLTALLLPQGMTYSALHDRLKRAGYVIYEGQSELKGRIFRIAHMGNLLASDLSGLLKSLKEVVEAHRAQQLAAEGKPSAAEGRRPFSVRRIAA